MKTIILSVLLLICSFCKGQDVKVYPVEITRPQYGINDSLAAPIKKVYDTIKVEMLVTSTDEANNKVVKIIGYEVGYEYHDNDCGNCPTFWKHVEYLDIVKKPIRNIHVWLSNQLK